MDAIRFEAPISSEEVKNVVRACGSDNASGPDELTFKFINKYWVTILEDVIGFIRHFEEYGTLSKGCNSSFITLAPKIKVPLTLSDYHPISLIGCLYKIIIKILVTGVTAQIPKYYLFL